MYILNPQKERVPVAQPDSVTVRSNTRFWVDWGDRNQQYEYRGGDVQVTTHPEGLLKTEMEVAEV
jgi:hypothetical protein